MDQDKVRELFLDADNLLNEYAHKIFLKIKELRDANKMLSPEFNKLMDEYRELSVITLKFTECLDEMFKGVDLGDE